MAEWKKIRLGNIIKTNQNTYSPKENWKFVNYLDTGNIKMNTVTEIQYINTNTDKLPSRARRKVKNNSIIYSTVRPNQLHYGIIKDQPTNFLVSTGFAVIDVDDKLAVPDYIYYLLTQKDIVEHLQSIAEQSVSAYPSLKPSDIENMEVLLPNIETQRKVVSILSSIDRKINCNKKINNNLEQQIEMILLKTINGTDTQPVKLGDYLYIKGRIGWKGLKKSEYLPISNYRIINGESLTLSGIDWNKAGYISAERYEESPEIMLSIGDILLSKDGTIGKIGYVDKLDVPTSVASGIFVIRNTRESEISTQFIYYLLKSKLFKAFISSRTEGSVIPHLYQKDFMEFEFNLPSPDDMKAFDSITATMFSLVFSNLNENERLTHLRNSLLPKLMSGELDASNIDI